MFKVSVLNSVNGAHFEGLKATQEEVDAWIAKNSHAKSWGTPEQITITKIDITVELDAKIAKKERLRTLAKKAKLSADELEELVKFLVGQSLG